VSPLLYDMQKTPISPVSFSGRRKQNSNARPHDPTLNALAACSDLGVHIDGFIATEATTVVVQSDADAAVTGRAADVVQAAATALEAALRLMRPGRKISEVAEPLQKVGL
jgi:Xaa-Pro aminopeptidase